MEAQHVERLFAACAISFGGKPTGLLARRAALMHGPVVVAVRDPPQERVRLAASRPLVQPPGPGTSRCAGYQSWDSRVSRSSRIVSAPSAQKSYMSPMLTRQTDCSVSGRVGLGERRFEYV